MNKLKKIDGCIEINTGPIQSSLVVLRKNDISIETDLNSRIEKVQVYIINRAFP